MRDAVPCGSLASGETAKVKVVAVDAAEYFLRIVVAASAFASLDTDEEPGSLSPSTEKRPSRPSRLASYALTIRAFALICSSLSSDSSASSIDCVLSFNDFAESCNPF